jgi:hypothetical protein
LAKIDTIAQQLHEAHSRSGDEVLQIGQICFLAGDGQGIAALSGAQQGVELCGGVDAAKSLEVVGADAAAGWTLGAIGVEGGYPEAVEGAAHIADALFADSFPQIEVAGAGQDGVGVKASGLLPGAV